MRKLETVFLTSLAGLPKAQLEEIASDGHIFSSPEWFSLLESLNLPEITQGDVRLRFAVVMDGGEPVAVMPLLSARGDGVYFLYSIRRYFFEYWIDEAVRLQPNRREYFARLFAGVNSWRRLLEWTGAPLDHCWVVGNPLSFRCQPAAAPDARRREVFARLVADLQQLSKRTKQPLFFLGVPDDDAHEPWRTALSNARCQASFLFHDNMLRLENYESFDDYLRSFKRTTRRAFERDIKRTEAAGVSMRLVQSYGGHADRFAELYASTYSRYGASYFRHPPEFWQKLERNLGDKSEAVLATRGEEVLGFSILLESVRRGEMFTYRIGRRSDAELADVPYYFCLSFYAPIRRAIELGYRRLWLGPASYEAKHVRGAEPVRLNAYFWFPRRWDRVALGNYLQMFGRISQQQLEQSFEERKGEKSTPEPTINPLKPSR